MPPRMYSVIGLVVLGLGISLPQSLIASDTPWTARGVVRASSSATLSSELTARIERLPFRTGQSFKQGDTLVSFDCSRYRAELRAAEAEVTVNVITAKQNRLLLRNRAIGSNELAISEARREQARAKADAIRVRLSQCAIVAPFDGRVSERLVDVFELPPANTPLLKIVKSKEPELDLIVPSNWINWLQPGKPFSFEIEETGTRHNAVVLHLGATVDAVSRTTKVSARLLDGGIKIRPGMSGVAIFQRPNG